MLELGEYEKLTVRWVKPKRGDAWWCRPVGREFKFLDPSRDGLFTVATAHVIGRLDGLLRDGARLPPVGRRRLQRIRPPSAKPEGVLPHPGGDARARHEEGVAPGPAAHVRVEEESVRGARGVGGVRRPACLRLLAAELRASLAAAAVRHAPAAVTQDGVFLMANPKYGEDMVHRLGMEAATAMATPIAKGRLPKDAEEPIVEPERINCVAVARFPQNYWPDIGYIVPELSHAEHAPSAADWERLRRLAR